MPTASQIRPAMHAPKIRHHHGIGAGALIHLGAIMAARAFEQKMEITSPTARTLNYTAFTLGASYVTRWLREHNQQEQAHAR
jgi:hypothetical protein